MIEEQATETVTGGMLLDIWRNHIRDVAHRRGRSDVYTSLETFHTCHGCGEAAAQLNDGLCPDCDTAYEQSFGKESTA